MTNLETPLPSKIQPAGGEHFALEARTQATRELAEDLNLKISHEFREDPHFWFRVGDIYPQELTYLLKIERELNAKLTPRRRQVIALTKALGYAEDFCRSDQKAGIDGLTGAWNRRSLDNYLELLRQQFVNPPGAPKNRLKDVALILFDVDHFKDFNDTHGHLAGDALLKHLAQTMRGITRPQDTMFARYGGEEFALVLPIINPKQEFTPGQIYQRMEQLRQQLVDNLTLTYEGHRLGTTVSMGVTMVSPKDGGISRIYERADAALYNAKNAGRNQAFSDLGKIIPIANK